MRIYISIGSDEYICVENGRPSYVVRGEPDPFSRVACPPIIWERVRGDLPYLSESEFARAKRARHAYTRLYEE